MSGAKKRPKAQRLFVTVTSEPEGLTDIHVTVERGGKLEVTLLGGPEDDEKPMQLGLPGGLRDQKRWVCDTTGMHPEVGE